MSRARGATPAMPIPLSARAAMTPATPVPCCSAALAWTRTKSLLIATWPIRSGWAPSTLLSITATRTPRPVAIWCNSARRQARAAGWAAKSGSLWVGA